MSRQEGSRAGREAKRTSVVPPGWAAAYLADRSRPVHERRDPRPLNALSDDELFALNPPPGEPYETIRTWIAALRVAP